MPGMFAGAGVAAAAAAAGGQSAMTSIRAAGNPTGELQQPVSAREGAQNEPSVPTTAAGCERTSILFGILLGCVPGVIPPPPPAGGIDWFHRDRQPREYS